MKKLVLLLTALLCLSAYARDKKSSNSEHPAKIAVEKIYRYRLTLKDKDHNTYSITHPEEFLSAKSLARRSRLGIAVDNYDLPITPQYLKGIQKTGAKIFNCSKWNNTVQVEIKDTILLKKLTALPYVVSSLLVYESPDSMEWKEPQDRLENIKNKIPFSALDYGKTQKQTDMLNLVNLHKLGYHGEGMTIGVLDGGFKNVDTISAFDHTKILGIRNFARPDSSIYGEHPHGMMVLSCMLPNLVNHFIGTAPEANYYLLQCEDTWYEYRGEEDNWSAALEYADSLGVDVVTSSLGYTHFDTPEVKFKYSWLDGEHELISRSASLAASRGILLCNSAGNEGDEAWKKIGFPADGKDIITVGAVQSDSINASFSSIGYTADHRIKPDAMSMGHLAYVLDTDGTSRTANGTSFACPILAGAVTCLWQAFPEKKPTDIIDAIHHAGNNFDTPDEVFGYGIPDMMKAYEWLKEKH